MTSLDICFSSSQESFYESQVCANVYYGAAAFVAGAAQVPIAGHSEIQNFYQLVGLRHQALWCSSCTASIVSRKNNKVVVFRFVDQNIVVKLKSVTKEQNIFRILHRPFDTLEQRCMDIVCKMSATRNVWTVRKLSTTEKSVLDRNINSRLALGICHMSWKITNSYELDIPLKKRKIIEIFKESNLVFEMEGANKNFFPVHHDDESIALRSQENKFMKEIRTEMSSIRVCYLPVN